MSAPIRLTEERRTLIRNRVITSAFAARDAEVAAEKTALGDMVYDSLYSGPLKQKMEALPAGYLPDTSGLRVQFGASSTGYVYVNFSSQRRVSNNHSRHTAANYENDDAKTIAFYATQLKEQAIEKEKHALRNKVSSLLASVNTVKKLNEVWPESAEFTEGMGQLINTLPAIIPAELNALIASAKA